MPMQLILKHSCIKKDLKRKTMFFFKFKQREHYISKPYTIVIEWHKISQQLFSFRFYKKYVQLYNNSNKSYPS